MGFEAEYHEQLKKVIAADPRYPEDAYDFVRAGVSHTGKQLKAEKTSVKRHHITGRQLLEGLRELALKEFGPLALEVLHEWGIDCTDDFGNIVFNLVNHKLLGASDEDSPDDFAKGYDFTEAFVKPFAEVGVIPDDLPKIV